MGYLSRLVPRAHKIAVFTVSEGGSRGGTRFDAGGERRDGRAEEVPDAGSLFQCYSCPNLTRLIVPVRSNPSGPSSSESSRRGPSTGGNAAGTDVSTAPIEKSTYHLISHLLLFAAIGWPAGAFTASPRGRPETSRCHRTGTPGTGRTAAAARGRTRGHSSERKKSYAKP